MLLGSAPSKTYLFFFRGDFSNWYAIRHLTSIKITYENLLTFFLKDLNRDYHTDFKPTDVILTCLNNGKKIDDLNAHVPSEIQGSPTDFYVQPKMFESKEQLQQTIHSFCYNFVAEGKKFEDLGLYQGAFCFYEAANIYGIRDFARMLFMTKNWDILKGYLEHLVYFFPNDLETNKIVAICYEKCGDIDNALAIYKKHRKKSDFMRIAYYRYSQKKKNDMSNFISELNKAISGLESFDRYLLEELVHLSLNLKKYKVGINCCLRTKETVKLLTLFTKNPIYYDRVIKMASMKVSNSYSIPIKISQILYKNGSRLAGIDIARNIVEIHSLDMISSRVCALLYLLLIDYRYAELIETFIEFMTKNHISLLTNLNITKIVQEFQNISIFNTFDLLNNKPVSPEENLNLEDYRSRWENIPNYARKENSSLISIFIIITVYLYLEKYVSEVNYIIRKLAPFITDDLDIDFNIVTYYKALVQSLKKDAFYSVPTVKTIALGDEFSIFSGYLKYPKNAVINQIIPNPFVSITIWELRKKSNSGLKKALLDRISYYYDIYTSNPNRLITFYSFLFTMGTHDCERVIPKLIKKHRFRSLYDAVESIINVYFEFIAGVIKKMPKLEYFILAPIPRFQWSSVITHTFNQHLLKRQLPSNVKIINPISSPKLFYVIDTVDNYPTEEYAYNLIASLEKS